MKAAQAQSRVIVGAAAKLGVKPEDVAAFYATHWTRRIALAIPSFYRWQFCEAPGCNGQDHCALAVDEHGGILGVMGVTPRPFVLAGKQRKAAEMTTWVVAESARGRGVGQAILNFLQGEYDVLLGDGISDAAIPLYRSAGFRFVRRLPRYANILKKPPSGFMRTSALGERLLQTRPPREIAVNAQEITAEQAAAVAERMLSGLHHYVRGKDEMRWRYDRHPVFRYRFFLIDGNAVVGLREDRVEGAGFVHVVELFGTENALPRAVDFVERFCVDNDLFFADATCLASAISRYLLSAGWFSMLDDTEVQLTSLFYPLEFRDPPTTSLMLWARDGMDDLMDVGRLYFMKGDLDLDRPTHAYYETHGLLGPAS